MGSKHSRPYIIPQVGQEFTSAHFDEIWTRLLKRGTDRISYDQALQFLRQLAEELHVRFDEHVAVHIIAEADIDNTRWIEKRDFLRLFFRSTSRANIQLSESMNEQERQLVADEPLTANNAELVKLRDAAVEQRVNMIRARLTRSGTYCLMESADIFQQDLWSRVLDDSYAGADFGHSGVFFLSFQSTRAANVTEKVCIKAGTGNTAKECAASFLARSLDLPSAEVRYVERGEEWQTIAELLQRQCPEEHKYKVQKALKYSGFLLSSYVRGSNLDQFAAMHARGANGCPAFQKKPCIQLGRILAFDVLTNNSDRLPLLWDNAGNMGNIMVQTQFRNDQNHKLIAIDSQMFDLARGNPLRDRYMGRTRQFLECLCKNPYKIAAEVQRVSDALQRVSYASFDAYQLKCIQFGILKGLQKIQTLTEEKFMSVLELVGAIAPSAKWLKSVKEIHVDFFMSMVNMIKEFPVDDAIEAWIAKEAKELKGKK